MRKWAERKWCDSRSQQKVKGGMGSVRRIERADCVLFRGHHSFTHGIRGRAGLEAPELVGAKVKLAFSICSLTCPPWSLHTFLCPTQLMQSSHPPLSPPIFLSLSHYSFLLPLYKNLLPHQSRLDFLLERPQSGKENMAPLPLSRIPNACTQTRQRYTINMHFALGTVSRRQMPANASKTDSEAFAENKKKKLRRKRGEDPERLGSDTRVGRLRLFLDGCLSWEMSLIHPPPPTNPSLLRVGTIERTHEKKRKDTWSEVRGTRVIN